MQERVNIKLVSCPYSISRRIGQYNFFLIIYHAFNTNLKKLEQYKLYRFDQSFCFVFKLNL